METLDYCRLLCCSRVLRGALHAARKTVELCGAGHPQGTWGQPAIDTGNQLRTVILEANESDTTGVRVEEGRGSFPLYLGQYGVPTDRTHTGPICSCAFEEWELGLCVCDRT